MFLDSGCVRAFDPELIDTWKRLQRAMLDDLFSAVKEALIELGLAPARDRLRQRLDGEHQRRVMDHLYRPFTCWGEMFRRSAESPTVPVRPPSASR